MKKLILSLTVIIAFVACNAIANGKTDSFKVYGNCGMCKKTIEKALKAEGIEGNWDKKTKMITVKYDSAKYTLQQVKEIICKAGYDNDGCRGDDKAYENLHECCKYDRKE